MNKHSNPKARGAKGGLARAIGLSASRRSEIAREGGLTRWSQDIPRALVDGEIDFAGRRISCAVLDTKLRVLTLAIYILGRPMKTYSFQIRQRIAPYRSSTLKKGFLAQAHILSQQGMGLDA